MSTKSPPSGLILCTHFSPRSDPSNIDENRSNPRRIVIGPGGDSEEPLPPSKPSDNPAAQDKRDAGWGFSVCLFCL